MVRWLSFVLPLARSDGCKTKKRESLTCCSLSHSEALALPDIVERATDVETSRKYAKSHSYFAKRLRCVVKYIST